MKLFLNKLVINGAKSIDKPIELLFSNRVVTESMDYSNSNVKAIYGPNGSGKSGIMAAMYIYKRIIEDPRGITNEVFSRFIYETINKKNKELSIDVIFTILDKNPDKVYCFKHTIVLVAKDEDVFIKKEEISILKGKSINDNNFKPLIKIEDGEIIELYRKKGRNIKDEPLYIHSFNLLEKFSITNTIFRLIKKFDYKYFGEQDVIISLISIISLSFNMIVELSVEDTHFGYISIKQNEEKFKSEPQNNEMVISLINEFASTDQWLNFSTLNKDIVDEKEFEKYVNNIGKLADFIRIFKPNLKAIDIDKKINNDKYYCDKIFVYDDKKINIEFESTGIKKLVKLFTTLKHCANGKVAFIDEMDSNLHVVYFTRLIEFFKNDSLGQLCFTTHNLEPIDVLKNNSHSLDFISDDSRVYSWTKDGNKSPMSKYINGLIPYSPFNVTSFDFDLLLEGE